MVSMCLFSDKESDSRDVRKFHFEFGSKIQKFPHLCKILLMGKILHQSAPVEVGSLSELFTGFYTF